MYLPTLEYRDGYTNNLRHWVRRLQALLAVEGYIAANTFDDQHRPDGLYGPGTRAAVKHLQKDRGLAVDGIAGNDTWSALLT